MTAALLAALCMTSCPHGPPVDDSDPTTVRIYSIAVQQGEHGNISVSPSSAAEGAQVSVFVNPDAGYRLKQDSLVFVYDRNSEFRGGIDLFGFPYRFSMFPANGYVTAEFIPVSAGNYTVHIGSSDNGRIETYPQFGPPGTKVTVYPQGNVGFGVTSIQANGVDVPFNTGYVFELGSADVTVTGLFERKTASEFLTLAKDMLSVGNYDLAFSYFESAYQADNANKEAIVYSTLGKLAGILIDPAVRPVLKQINLAVVGNTLNEWFCDTEWMQGKTDNARWYAYYVPDMDDGSTAKDGSLRYDPNSDRQYYDTGAWLPRLGYPRNFPTGGFNNYNITHASVNNSQETFRWFWDALLLYNLIGNNENGINNLLADVNNKIFGSAFEEAASRYAKLSFQDNVALHPRLKSRFHLKDFYGPSDMMIGKAELDLIFSMLRSVKAGIEFLAAYDWEMDTRMLRINGVAADFGMKEIFEKIVYNIDLEISNTGSRAFLSRLLPLRNHFLKDKNNGMMPKAKNDLVKAVTTAKAAYAYYSGSTSHITTEGEANLASDWAWADDLFTKLQNGLNSGGNFYFSMELPRGQPSWYDATSGKYGLNLAQFFTPGSLSIDRLLVTEGNGQYPVFYKLSYNWGNLPYPDSKVYTGTKTKMNAVADFGSDSDDIFSFELNATNIRRVLVKGMPEGPGTELFCVAVPEIPVWKSYVPGGVVSGNWGLYKASYFDLDNAKKLFEYYR